MRLVCTTACIVIAVASGQAMAGRCAGATGDQTAIVMCEDFDRYCNAPPTDPQLACNCRIQDPDLTNPPDAYSYYMNWPPLGTCSGSGGATAMHDLVYWRVPGDKESWKCHKDATEGYMTRIYQSDQTLGVSVYRHERDITSLIHNQVRNTAAYNYVNGAGPIDLPIDSNNTVPSGYVNSGSSTLRPDALKGRFMMYFDGAGAHANMINYVEFYLDNDRAPFDFTTTFCPAATSPSGGSRYAVSLPKLTLTDGQMHSSFALGVVATMDRNPCDLDTGWLPTDYHLAVYDGMTWRIFKTPTFGIPNVSPEHGADLMPKDGWNTVYFYIGADDIEVRLSNSWSSQNTTPNGSNNPNSYCVARLPRVYKGPFNKVAIGPNKALDLVTPSCENYGTVEVPNYKCNGGANNQGVCTTSADCPPATTPVCPLTHAGNNMYIDELTLWDGIFQEKDAACCKPDLTCSIMSMVDCQAAGGVFHTGGVCDPSPCCPVAWPDSDNDKDVDMQDFAALQRCVTDGQSTPVIGAGCGCFDQNKDGAINASDVEKFALCAQGDGVAVGVCPP